jgi:hypothetical protein
MNRFQELVAIIALASLVLTGTAPSNLRAAQAVQPEVSLPFVLTDQNNIVVKAVFNGTDTLNLMLHTAASDVTVTEDARSKSTSVKFTGSTQAEAWGGKADLRFSKGNQIQIGTLRRDNMTVWEDKNSGKGTDGKFGLDFFQNQQNQQNRIVEIDFDQSRITLRDSLPRKVETYERLKLEKQNGQLFVTGNCLIEGKAYANKFLIHSGYSGGILIDDAFVASAGIDGKIKITDESVLKDSFGNSIKVKKGILPTFAMGSLKIADVPVGYFAGGLGAQKISVMGCEVLTQFNIVFDLARNDLYLSPRRSYRRGN